MDYTKIKWWDRRAFIVSAAGFSVLLIGLLLWLGHVMPTSGYQFEKSPPIEGIFRCCEGNGRYSASWVGSKQVICGAMSYFPLLRGSGGNACSRVRYLDGHKVKVILVKIPSMGENYELASRVEAYGRVFYEKKDDELRRNWVESTRIEAFFIAAFFFIATYSFQLSRLKENH